MGFRIYIHGNCGFKVWGLGSGFWGGLCGLEKARIARDFSVHVGFRGPKFRGKRPHRV